MISIEEIKFAEENNKCLYIPNALNNVPTWELFFKVLSHKYNTDDTSNNPDHFIANLKNHITDIFIYNNLDIQFWNAARYDRDEVLFPQIEEFLNFTKNIVNGHGWQVKALMNLVANEADYAAHKDGHHVVSWQCIGNVEYRIYDNVKANFADQIDHLLTDVPYVSYILKPGDVIFMPTGIVHKAVVTEPRATLILDRW